MPVVGYLFGCINSSIILTRLIEKKDVRDFGSKNAGFTNTLRHFKLRTAVLVFLGDSLKAAVALSIAKLTAPGNGTVLYLTALGVILGHNFPFIHHFKGGKGVLVSIVAVMFADWRIGLIILVAAVTIMLISRYVSLGSIVGSVLFPILTVIFHFNDIAIIFFSVAVSLLSIFMHRKNIYRLYIGTENRFGGGKKNG
jgi:glycerol-3-phosphate acyltransferase PlsY